MSAVNRIVRGSNAVIDAFRFAQHILQNFASLCLRGGFLVSARRSCVGLGMKTAIDAFRFAQHILQNFVSLRLCG